MVEIKKPEDVAEIGGGAATTGFFDWLLQDLCYRYNLHGKFPYVAPIPQLPPIDDWILAGVPTVLAGIGELAKNKDLANAGFGGSLYGWAMILHHILLRSITWPMAGIPYAAPAPPPGAPPIVTPPKVTKGRYVVT